MSTDDDANGDADHITTEIAMMMMMMVMMMMMMVMMVMMVMMMMVTCEMRPFAHSIFRMFLEVFVLLREIWHLWIGLHLLDLAHDLRIVMVGHLLIFEGLDLVVAMFLKHLHRHL